jgi:SAM-dependent methyltransferase
MKVFAEEYAGIYDYLYQDKNYEGECDFIESIFNRFSKRVRTVLDLGCGTGSHALVLSKRGYQVIGVDRSKRMLDIAKRKADKASLSIEFIEADIRNFNLQERFDAVISLFAVMSYQTTNEAIAEVCKVARKHLVPKGVFLFDCWNGLAVLTDKPTIRIKEVRLNDKERIIRLTEPILNPLTHTSEIRFKVLKIQEERLLNEFEECHLMRYLFPQEIKYFLEVAGFKKVEFCPFLELEKPLTENDWNMTVIANAG